MISELCFKLREKREKLGLTIEGVVEKTKLHPGAIHDIEEGKLANISPAYLKGFIKIYANFLGVEIGNSLDELPSANSPVKSVKNISSSLATPKKEPQTSSDNINFVFPILKVSVLIIIFFIGILGIFLGIKNISTKVKDKKNVTSRQEKHKSVKTSTVKSKPAIKETTKSLPARSAPVKSQVNEPLSFKPKEIISPKNIPPVLPNQEITVGATAKKNCFIRVKVDGRVLSEGVLKKGAVETWKGKKMIEFRINDGSAVYLEVNGVPLPQLTSLKKPIKSLQITPTEISVDK